MTLVSRVGIDPLEILLYEVDLDGAIHSSLLFRV